MAVTVTYSLNFVKNLDLTVGPATSNPDATSLANGGFAVSGDFGSNSTLDIFKPDTSSGGGTASISGVFSAVDQLSNGNIVVASRDNDSVRFSIKTATGGNVTSGDLGFDDQFPDVAAIAGGGFWVAGHTHSGLRGDIDIYRFNVDGVYAGAFAVDLTDANDQYASIAGLDNGNIAVAWTREVVELEVWYAVYDPAGGVIRAPTHFLTGGPAERPSVSATADGFVIAFWDNGWGTGGYDITQAQFAPDGTFLRGGNVSNPDLLFDPVHDVSASVARLSNNFLAVAYVRGDDTIVALVDPATGGVLATRNVVGGEPVTDIVGAPTIAGFRNGGIAVFHTNVTDVDVDGEHLQAQRTSVGDGAADVINGDSFRDVFLGNGGNDTLRGSGGNDDLSGGDGSDRLNGGKGVDVMTGGPGPDRFIFIQTADSGKIAATRDHITDFVHLTDDLDLAAIDAKTGTPGNDTFSFRGTLAFDAEGQVRVVQSGAHTIVQLNTTGLTGAEMTIQLDNFTATTLTAADFFL